MKTKYGKSVGSMSLNIVGSCLLIAAMLVLGASAAQAEVIYHDDFNGTAGTILEGQAPDVRPGDEVWSATAVFKYDGSGGVNLEHTSSTIGRTQLLPLTIKENLKYTLTARIKNPLADTDDNWIGIGWSENHHYDVFSNANNNGAYYMLWRGSNIVESRAGPAHLNYIGSTGDVGGEDNMLDVRVILDQLADTPTAYFQYKNPSSSDWTDLNSTELTQARLDAINYVGLSGFTDTGLQSFTLEAIPEPGSGIIFVTAGVLLWLARRRYNA